MRIYRAGARVCLALLLVLNTTVAPVPAKDFDQLVPDDASLFVGVKSLSGLRQWIASSPFAELWASKDMEAFRKEVESLETRMNPAGKEGYRELQDFLGLLGGEVALVLGNVGKVDVKAAAKGAEIPLALLAGCQGKRAEVGEVIKKALQKGIDAGHIRRGESTEFRGATILEVLKGEKAPKTEDGPKKFYVAQGDEVLGVGLEKRQLQDILANLGDTTGKTLRDQPRYRATRDVHGPNVAVLGYINFDGLGSLIQAIAAESSPQESEMPLKIMARLAEILGVSTLQATSLSLSLESAMISSTFHLLMAGEPQGLLKVLAAKPQKLRFPGLIPDDVASCSVTQLDMGALYGVIQGIAKFAGAMMSGNPDEGGGGIDFLQLYEQQLGIKIQDDLLGPLSGQVVDYSRIRKPFSEGSQEMAVLLELKDKDRFQATLDKLFAMIPFFRKSAYLDSTLYVMSAGAGGQGNDQEKVAALAIGSSHFVLGIPKDAAEEVIRRQGKEVKSVVDTDAFKAVASYFPPTATLIQYANSDGLEYLIYLLKNMDQSAFLPSEAGEGGADGKAEVGPEDILGLCKKLPEPAVLVKPISGSVSYGQSDERGLYWTSKLIFKKK